MIEPSTKECERIFSMYFDEYDMILRDRSLPAAVKQNQIYAIALRAERWRDAWNHAERQERVKA